MAGKVKTTKAKPNRRAKKSVPDVLTLDEAAAYLRVGPEQVQALAATGQLPAQQIGVELRFLKAAIDDWLRRGNKVPTPKDILMAQFGALKDDETLPALIEWLAGDRGEPRIAEKAG